MADLPKLKAAVADGDPRTAEPIARDYRDRVRSDVLVLTDREGRTLVSLGADAAGWTDVARPFRVEGGRLLETVDAPIVLDTEALGHLVLGFALDDAFAARLRALTGSHVAVAMEGRVFASTLPRRHDAALLAAAGGTGVARVDLRRRGARGPDARPLGAGEGAPLVLVLRSRAEALRPLLALRSALAVAALVAVGLGLLLSWALARTVTRPLAALTDAMKRIAATGDLGLSLGAGRPWDDEDARLVARTFGALTDSIARFQREATLRERLSALGRLSTVIAHEVRNPLMIIKGTLRSPEARGGGGQEVREAAADIDHEVARLDRIVGDVLDFARPLRLERAPVDVRAARAGRGAGRPRGSGRRRGALRARAVRGHDPHRRRAAAGRPRQPDRERPREPRRRGPVERGGDRGRRPGARSRGRSSSGWPTAAPGFPRRTSRTSSSRTSRPSARGRASASRSPARSWKRSGESIRIESREGEGTRVEIELPAEAPAPTEVR